jgi:RNA polymerase sigma factor (TIGR02999 family)
MTIRPAASRSVESSRGAPPTSESVTALLDSLRSGNADAFGRIVPLVYAELRRAARRELARRPGGTLVTTALVHEAYLRLAHGSRREWRDRAHFLRVAAVAMRHILVDRARRRVAGKRGGDAQSVTLDECLAVTDERAASLLELDEALKTLERIDARLARVVECRFYGGMTERETAEVLKVTERTVRRDWVKARALLHLVLSGGAPPRRGLDAGRP